MLSDAILSTQRLERKAAGEESRANILDPKSALFLTGCRRILVQEEGDADQGPFVITTADGIQFVEGDLPYRLITEVPEYDYEDIRKDDVVIDIGANAGAFALRAARLSRHVFAIEPVTWRILEENIWLNKADVHVIRGALGDGRRAAIHWDTGMEEVPTFTLRQIRSETGGCDFLKCDCEGAEWFIDPQELHGIRRIEMELHLPPISCQPNPALLEYIGTHYAFTITRVPCHGPLGLLGYLHAERKA